MEGHVLRSMALYELCERQVLPSSTSLHEDTSSANKSVPVYPNLSEFNE